MRKLRFFFIGVFLNAGLAFSSPQNLVAPGSDLIPERTMSFAGGMEDHRSTFLSENAKNLVNLHLNNRGQLTTRSGYVVNARPGSNNTVTGGSYHTAQTGTPFFAVIIGTNVWRTSNAFGGSFTDVTNSVPITAGASNLAQSASLNDWKVFVNELDAPFKINATGNAQALAGGSPTLAKTVCEFNAYLFFANTRESGTSYPSRIRWSDLGTVDSWPANNYVDLDPNDGDSIQCVIVAWRQMLVFKKRSVYSGTITGLPGANAFIFRPISRNIGCWAKNSVVSISDHGVFFQGPDGIYCLSGFNYFGLPTISQISDPIYNEFLKINHSAYATSVGGVFRKYNQYWLAISTGSSLSNNEILVYDYAQGNEQNGFRAWTTYSGINPSMLATAEDSSANEILLSGDSNGYVYKQDVGASDNPQNSSTSISFSYTSQDVPLNAPDLDKSLKYLYTFLTSDISTTSITVNIAYDFSLSYADSYSFPVGTSGALWGTAVWGTDIWPQSGYKVSRLDLNRDHVKTYRIQYTGTSSKTTKVTLLGYSLVYKPMGWNEQLQ